MYNYEEETLKEKLKKRKVLIGFIIWAVMISIAICAVCVGLRAHYANDSNLKEGFLTEVTQVYKSINDNCITNGVYNIPSVKQELLSLGYSGHDNDNITVMNTNNDIRKDVLRLQVSPGSSNSSYGPFYIDFTVGSNVVVYKPWNSNESINYTIKN